LGEKEHRQNQVDCREYYIVYYRFDLRRCIIPSSFDCTRNIAGTGCHCSCTQHTDHNQSENERDKESFTVFHNFSHLSLEEETEGIPPSQGGFMAVGEESQRPVLFLVLCDIKD
jgi:hypothetical protein